MEQGKFEPTEEGSAQGSVMSPMLANIYMHHVLTLWFKLVVQREMQGECFLVNFADDFVAGFQYKSEAERYYKELKERMEKFGLELMEEVSTYTTLLLTNLPISPQPTEIKLFPLLKYLNLN